MLAGIIVVVIGVIFLLKELGYIAFINWDLIWPILIIVVGIGMISRRCRRCGMKGFHCCHGSNPNFDQK
jgi:hypothetical protein